MQSIEPMYQYGLMDAIHEHWKRNEPIQLVLIDRYLLDVKISHKPNFDENNFYLNSVLQLFKLT
jgi:hypothetical protein